MSGVAEFKYDNSIYWNLRIFQIVWQALYIISNCLNDSTTCLHFTDEETKEKKGWAKFIGSGYDLRHLTIIVKPPDIFHNIQSCIFKNHCVLHLSCSLSCVWLCNPIDCSLLGKNTRMGCHASRGSFPTQGSNLGLPHWRQILYHLNHLCLLHLYMHKNIPSRIDWWNNFIL